jgi:glycosyltransferase involved in cell wall biosynthesis
MKRVLIISDSVKRKTGYATVARNILKNLIPTGKYVFAQLGLADIPIQPDFDIDYYSQIKDHNQCCQKGNVIEYRAAGRTDIQFINLEPGVSLNQNQKECIRGINAMGDHYAYDSVYFVVQHFKPDIVIPINDIWGLYNISHLRNRECFKFIPYLAVDSECMFPILQPPEGRPGLPPIEPVKVIGTTDKTVVFTDWAQEVINKTCKIVTGGKTLTNMVTIPHGVDTTVWKPLPQEEKDKLRKQYFNIGEEVFLVGSVARNQPRKRLDAIFQTLRIFIDKYETKNKQIKCYFHCSLEDQLGWNLLWLAAYYNVQDRCIFDQRLKPGVGPTDEQLNEIVNCFDVHLSLTNSEGWHLPALETAAAGIPNIITKYSAHADWGKDTLLFSKVGAWEHEPRTGFVKAIADVDNAAHQLKLLYSSKEMRKDYQNRGIKLGQKLDWPVVCKIWEELLDSTDTSGLKDGRYNDPKYLVEQQPIQQSIPNQGLTLKYFPGN